MHTDLYVQYISPMKSISYRCKSTSRGRIDRDAYDDVEEDVAISVNKVSTWVISYSVEGNI